jgi:hypothetical protein
MDRRYPRLQATAAPGRIGLRVRHDVTEGEVKTDDPRLEESRKKLLERLQKINDLILAVLKNHLVVEQFMNGFLDASGEKHDELSFAEKANLCKELKPAEIDPPIWSVLTKGNQLRNKIAHTLDQTEIQVKMDELREAYLAALTEKQAEAAKKLDDVRIAAAAFELCGAYLVAATDAAPARKKSVTPTHLADG